MKNIKTISFGFIIGFILLSGLMERAAEAQPSKVPKGRSFSETPPKGACQIDPSITFTEEQTKELENLRRAYLEEAKPLWGEIRDLRLELRFAVSDPQAQYQALLDKQRKMSSIQAELENLRFSYLIKVRSIFTKEQLERMPPDCPLKMGTGYEIGRGLERGPRKGWR